MPERGDIGLVPIGGNVGKLIRVGQWLNGDGFRNYEHAFMYIQDGKMVEAQPGGAVYSDIDRYGSVENILWLPCPDEYRSAVGSAAVALLGTPYSFLDYGALAAVRLHMPSKAIRRYVMSTGHMICSQLVDEAASRGGWHIFTDGRLPQDVTPGDLSKVALHLA